ncbi:MAG: chorismate mutase [Actinomycetia bacterium]|nr:chorismate mutase [Actinomycetes bacterium]
MSSGVRALRGATTIDNDTREEMDAKVVELLELMLDRNQCSPDEIISALFTATDDLDQHFPAASARTFLPADVPVMCARELDIGGSLARCVRIMMHVESDLARAEVQPVYRGGAQVLRPDLGGSAVDAGEEGLA